MSTPRLPFISDAAMALARRLWDEGADRAAVARAAGCSPGRLFDRGLVLRTDKGRIAHPSLADDPLPRRQGRGGGRPSSEIIDPSPTEITAACRKIRRGWNERTHQERRYEGAPDLTAWRNRSGEADVDRRQRIAYHQGGQHDAATNQPEDHRPPPCRTTMAWQGFSAGCSRHQGPAGIPSSRPPASVDASGFRR